MTTVLYNEWHSGTAGYSYACAAYLIQTYTMRMDDACILQAYLQYIIPQNLAV